MAQQVIPAAQLVPRFHTIGRCNNYAVLQSIPCSPECKIVGPILLDHPLSYALELLLLMSLLLDMFRDILHFLVETPENPFVAPVNIETIEAFMNRVGYQGVVDKKEAIQYPRFIKLILADLMKKFLEIPQRIEESYHSIKDDIPLVNVYTTRDVRVREMLILDAFLTEEIHATDDFKEYEMVFMNVDVLMNQPQPVVSTQGTHRSTPRAHMTPNLTASPQGKKRKQIVGESSSPRKTHKITFKNYIQSNVIQVPPTTTTSTETTSSADLHQQLYFKMKRSLQDQANDQVLWKVLKHKFEKSSTSNTSCRDDDIHSHHDDHQEDDAPPEGEKRVKRHKASKSSKSARGSSSKHSAKDSTTYERVHDFQLGIESYQIKVNLTIPTLIFPGIEAHEPYFIVDKASIGLIYLNSKDNKRVMYLTKIVKFCDATLEKVLKEVKLKIFQSETWRKPPLIGELDRDILRAFEREITKRLSHREQMRRWEYFLNGRRNSYRKASLSNVDQGGGDDDGCGVSNEGVMPDLLQDGLEYGDDGADNEDPNSDDDEYSNDGGDEDPNDKPNDNGGGA
ncbi:hypothetical protein Tco_0452753 [Tanacetum coccineum]